MNFLTESLNSYKKVRGCRPSLSPPDYTPPADRAADMRLHAENNNKIYISILVKVRKMLSTSSSKLRSVSFIITLISCSYFDFVIVFVWLLSLVNKQR